MATTVRLVEDGFAGSDRRAGPIGGLIRRFTKGHPMRTMQLADACWSATERDATTDAGTYADAAESLAVAEAEPLERIFSGFADGEKGVLRAAAVPGSVYGTEAALLGVVGGAAANARRRFLDAGDLVPDGSGVAVTDSLMAHWIRRRFPL